MCVFLETFKIKNEKGANYTNGCNVMMGGGISLVSMQPQELVSKSKVDRATKIFVETPSPNKINQMYETRLKQLLYNMKNKRVFGPSQRDSSFPPNNERGESS